MFEQVINSKANQPIHHSSSELELGISSTRYKSKSVMLTRGKEKNTRNSHMETEVDAKMRRRQDKYYEPTSLDLSCSQNPAKTNEPEAMQICDGDKSEGKAMKQPPFVCKVCVKGDAREVRCKNTSISPNRHTLRRSMSSSDNFKPKQSSPPLQLPTSEFNPKACTEKEGSCKTRISNSENSSYTDHTSNNEMAPNYAKQNNTRFSANLSSNISTPCTQNLPDSNNVPIEVDEETIKKEEDDAIMYNIPVTDSPNTDDLHVGSSSGSSQEQPVTSKHYGFCRPNSLLPRPGNPPKKQFSSRSKRHSSRTNLYIRGLPNTMGENDLVNLVPDASAIRSVKLVINNEDEGYGFIDFVSNEAAVVAMQHIKSQNANQYINFAYESEKDPLNVYVTNIPEAWNSDNVENLKQIFSPYGKIISALVMTRRSTNKCTGTGFVRYLTSEEAQKAIDGIRKAKITLPGAKRPLELKLADQQRAREHKNVSCGSESNTIPLFQQFMREDMQINRNLGGINNQIGSEDIFSECANRMFINGGLQNFDPLSVLPVKFTPKTNTTEFDSKIVPSLDSCSIGKFTPLISHHHSPNDGLVSHEHFSDASISPHPSAVAQVLEQTSASHLPVVPIPGLAPIYQFPCMPWIQDAVAVATYIHPQATALTTPKSAGNGNRTPGAPAPGMDLASLAYNIGLNQQNFNFRQLPVEMVLPFLNNVNGQPIDASSLYPFGMNQPALWPKACFYG